MPCYCSLHLECTSVSGQQSSWRDPGLILYNERPWGKIDWNHTSYLLCKAFYFSWVLNLEWNGVIQRNDLRRKDITHCVQGGPLCSLSHCVQGGGDLCSLSHSLRGKCLYWARAGLEKRSLHPLLNTEPPPLLGNWAATERGTREEKTDGCFALVYQFQTAVVKPK